MKIHVMIAVSPYYKEISEGLLRGAKTYLEENDCTFEEFEVTGALELPLAIKMGHSSATKDFNAYIALGCVIRGETSHYDIVAEESARGLMDLMLEYDISIGNGILTCDNMTQAIIRADPRQKNKGKDAAKAAVEMFKLKRQLHAV